jgi:hypothetical protein
MKHLSVFLSVVIIALLLIISFVIIYVPKNTQINDDVSLVYPITTPNVIMEITPSPSPKPIMGNGIDSQITMMGTVSTANSYGTYVKEGYNPTYIKFTDKETGEEYVASISGTSYSIGLLNQHQYDVRGYWNGTAGVSKVSQAVDVAVKSDGVMFSQDLVFPM